MTSCPRCGEPLASGQEYCLVCGARFSDGRRGARSTSSGWVLRAAAAGAVAVIGAALAVVATGSDGGRATVTTAIGGFATAPDSTTGEAPIGPSGVAEWPTDEDGWTIALASLPQTAGRAAALARARTARRKASATGRRARLVALREPPSRLLDRVLGRVLVGGRGDERARGRPQGVENRCRPSRRALTNVAFGGTTSPDFVTPPKRRYTLRAKRHLRSFFAQQHGNRGDRRGPLDDHAAQLRSCMYQYSRAIYRSIKDLIDPYASREEQLGHRRAVLIECERTMARLAEDPSLLRPSGSRAVRRHPALLPDHGAGSGRLVGPRGHRRGHVVHRAAGGSRPPRRRDRTLPRHDAEGQSVPTHAAPEPRLLPVAPAPRASSRRRRVGADPSPESRRSRKRADCKLAPSVARRRQADPAALARGLPHGRATPPDGP